MSNSHMTAPLMREQDFNILLSRINAEQEENLNALIEQKAQAIADEKLQNFKQAKVVELGEITVNSVYEVENPFGDKLVHAVVEIKFNDIWFTVNNSFYSSYNDASFGVVAEQRYHRKNTISIITCSENGHLFSRWTMTTAIAYYDSAQIKKAQARLIITPLEI